MAISTMHKAHSRSYIVLLILQKCKYIIYSSLFFIMFCVSYTLCWCYTFLFNLVYSFNSIYNLGYARFPKHLILAMFVPVVSDSRLRWAPCKHWSTRMKALTPSPEPETSAPMSVNSRDSKNTLADGNKGMSGFINFHEIIRLVRNLIFGLYVEPPCLLSPKFWLFFCPMNCMI